MEKQVQNFGRFAKGEAVSHFSEIFLLIFADLKKHLFTYQFYSTAIPVKNYSVKSWRKFNEVYQAGEVTLFSNFIKETAVSEKVFPQFTILDEKFKRVSFSQFVEQKDGRFMFVVVDSSNLDNATGYHTSTALAFFAWLRQ